MHVTIIFIMPKPDTKFSIRFYKISIYKISHKNNDNNDDDDNTPLSSYQCELKLEMCSMCLLLF